MDKAILNALAVLYGVRLFEISENLKRNCNPGANQWLTCDIVNLNGRTVQSTIDEIENALKKNTQIMHGLTKLECEVCGYYGGGHFDKCKRKGE